MYSFFRNFFKVWKNANMTPRNYFAEFCADYKFVDSIFKKCSYKKQQANNYFQIPSIFILPIFSRFYF
jgi:hypothetical protein